ncbi:ATP-binding protein [Planomonospora venezuelensis]|uniref:Putative ATPase/DNA-binding CsgD family transcriptional regulator n=1 Tax=Planomonospora venezuelensis TaxID=1999 RepID=A0A841D1L7_PLAVE|nr:putative ATPase/DNA-binding CsgD family transcriptional regulator [Planomonospora venezuelensis]GIN05731.1 hypothetical protein Pve01_73890 [Planomonospora venezuelensis]
MDQTHPVEVSAREAEVLALLGLRLSNAQIGGRLHVSVRTVEGHVSSLLRKYGVADRRALAELAATAGGGTPPPVGQVTGLPRTRTSFVGRAGEQKTVLAVLGETRLVTLLGPGGVGKTRLAAVAAETAAPSFPFGVVFVDLIPVRGEAVTQAVAAALGVTERAQQPLAEAVVERLGRGRSLLVLDNCEHLIDAVAELAERVLSDCPETTILATSRERLGLPGERTVPVAPLPLDSDAERLFRERALAADPGFTAEPAAVADLCARLDGLPLAIELAAARCASLGAAGLLTGLGDYVRLLAGGRGPAVRHRSLGAVIGWSHDLLAEEERVLFRRLAVLAGAFGLEAVAAVAADGDRAVAADLLGRLVDKSLVARGRAGGWRLLETVRAFAAGCLDDSGERQEIRRRHLEWAVDAASVLEARLGGDGGRDGWRDDFDAVAGDLRAALAAAPPGPDPAVHRLARTMGGLAFARRFLAEAFDHYRQAAERAPGPGEAARDLYSAAGCACFVHGAGQRVFDLLLASAERARAAGDGDAEAIALASAVVMVAGSPAGFAAEVPHERLRSLFEQAVAAGDPREPRVAAHLALADAWIADPRLFEVDIVRAETAVAAARATGDPVLVLAALDGVGAWALAPGRRRKGSEFTSERLSLLAGMSRDDPRAAPEIFDTYRMAAAAALATGDLRTAVSVSRWAWDDDLIGASHIGAVRLVTSLALTGDFDEVLRLAPPLWDGWKRAGSPVAGILAPPLAAVALVHGLRGDERGCRMWRARAGAVMGGVVRDHATFTTFVDVRLAVHTRRFDDAAALMEVAFTENQTWSPPYACAAAAELAVVAGFPDAERHLAAVIPAAEENDWAAACLARARGRLHGDAAALEESVDGWERIGARFERACTLALLPGREAEGRAELAALGIPPGTRP